MASLGPGVYVYPHTTGVTSFTITCPILAVYCLLSMGQARVNGVRLQGFSCFSSGQLLFILGKLVQDISLYIIYRKQICSGYLEQKVVKCPENWAELKP